MPTTTAERTSPLRAGLAILLTAVLTVVGSVMFAPAERADAAALPSSILEGGYLISDAEFFDGDSMTASQIQSFLNARVPTCKAKSGDPTCLKSFKATLPTKAADAYCKKVTGKSGATAAEIIDRVAAACGINPKVIIVMLQKEQGLVTSSAPSSWAYRAAMGQSCPDTAPCDAAAAGFVNQVYLGARQMQVYTLNPSWWSYKAGQVNTIQWHPNSSCGTSKVYIQNQATANLYIYTPYRPNVAALAAGYGTGDDCSTYGNRNFYNYYESWFEPGASSSTGAPAQVKSCQVPASNDIATRTGTATVTSTTVNVRTAPTLVCSSGLTTLKKGAKVTITGAYGMWTRATVGGKTTWIASKSLKLPSTGAPAGGTNACAQPAESSVTKAGGTVTVATSVLNARTAPTTSCETGRIQLSQGDTATRTGEYGAWWRVTVSGKTYWVHSDYAAVKDAPAPEAPATTGCESPANPKTAKQTYVVTLPQVKGRTGPSDKCDDIVKTLKKGDRATASAVSADGQWLRVKGGSSGMWIARRAVTAVTSAPANACAAPSNPKAAKRTYVVTLPQVKGRTGPSDKCNTVIKTLKKGAVATATAVSADGQWLRIKGGSSGMWIARRAVTALPMKTTSTTMTMRASASRSAAAVTTVPRSKSVTVLETRGSWSKATYGSKTGWMITKYLR